MAAGRRHAVRDNRSVKQEEHEEVVELLQDIVAFELAGVIRFTHYALMVRGPFRIPLVTFFQEQAVESLQHAQRAGEILTGLGGHPDMKVPPIDETHQHSVAAILEVLPPREAFIMRLRHGVDGTDVHTLEDIGCMLGITRERTRQLEVRAYKRLREALSPELLRGLD